MRASIVVCDHCGGPGYGLPMTRYQIGAGPVVDICASCEEKPFRRLTEAHPRVVAMVREIARLELTP